MSQIASMMIRNRERDRQLRELGRQIDAWSVDLEQRLLGVVAARRGDYEGVVGTTDVILIGSVQAISDILENGLGSLTEWSIGFSSRLVVDSAPIMVWVRRLLPAKTLAGTEGMCEQTVDGLDAQAELDRILSGSLTGAEARALLTQLEFGTPTPEAIDRILLGTNAPDGLSAMQRIKTVTAPVIDELRGLIRTNMSGTFEGASSVESLAKAIRPLVGNDPGKSTGMNYRAKRIARTEGIRVAEEAQQTAWGQVADMLKGMRTFTAGDMKVRVTHRKWHNKLYRIQPDGTFFNSQVGLGRMPVFPAGPNCRCWTVAELRDDLTAGIQGAVI